MKRLATLCLTLALLTPQLASANSVDRNAFAETLSEMLDKQAAVNPSSGATQGLYQQRRFTALWFQANQPTRQALQVLNVLRDAAGYGLRANDYRGIALSYQLATLASANFADAKAAQARAQIDLGLSNAVLKFLHDLHYGRIDPRRVGFNLQVARRNEFDPSAILSRLASEDNPQTEIARLEPQFQHYQLLKSALSRYRLLAVDAELTQLPSFIGRSIKAGQPYPGAPALRRLLVAEQDLQASEAAESSDFSLDPALVKGLQQYQQRHGLQPDGNLGQQTFAALTTPFATRVRQIELTLERWRWLPPLQSPMIVVNIPQFKLFAFNSADDHEANLLRMEVIVGQAFPHTQTPIFLADMKYVVFRPYWDVPRDIVQREMLPAIHKDPNYLARNQLELVRGQSDTSPVLAATPENLALLAAGSLRVRQQPGDNNALGEMKFMFPNQYNVYLHSTPAKHLFGASRRAFSHGCIRVSDPTALAEYVLHNAPTEWNKEQITAAMQGQPNQRVNLQSSIPVMIVYGTVMVTESGTVQFFDDLYGHDKKLAVLL